MGEEKAMRVGLKTDYVIINNDFFVEKGRRENSREGRTYEEEENKTVSPGLTWEE